jgi:hypothetical protein
LAGEGGRGRSVEEEMDKNKGKGREGDEGRVDKAMVD